MIFTCTTALMIVPLDQDSVLARSCDPKGTFAGIASVILRCKARNFLNTTFWVLGKRSRDSLVFPCILA